MRLHEKFRPRCLDDIVGQPLGPLKALVARPEPCCVLLEGPTGCGKTTTAYALAGALGCYQDQWFETVHTVCGADFNAETVRYYFGGTSPFRLIAPGGWHVLVIEELEQLHPKVQQLCKDALERRLSHYRCIVVATSNNAMALEKALRHRFKTYTFSAGTCFADTTRLQERFLYRKGLLAPSAVSESLKSIVLRMDAVTVYPGTYWVPQHALSRWQALARDVEQLGEGQNRLRQLTTVMDEHTAREVRDALIAEMNKAANGIELEAAMANRMYHHKWELDQGAVLEGYISGLEFPEPSFPRLPDNWQDNLPGVGGMVAAFHRKNPGRLSAFPNERAEQSGPWPSPRTWEYAIRCLAAAQSVGAGKAVELTLLSGLVGEAVALEFSQWLFPRIQRALED